MLEKIRKNAGYVHINVRLIEQKGAVGRCKATEKVKNSVIFYT